ncbi:MAG TPA: FUSC family protein [Reyranella sp.]|nr:FUSC family protein [Reyranella sp.]
MSMDGSIGSGNRLRAAWEEALPALVHGLRLSASVILALAVAYWLELDNAFWAGTSAGIVCQPSLGASLRKGWFRAIGTAIGAVFIVVLTAVFPQNRIGLLIGLDLWCGLCGLMATILRNFAGYAAALAGYTAAIVFADALTAPGETFALAVSRATEICIGILSAGVVLMLTDVGSARRQLGRAFAGAIDTVRWGLAATLAAGLDLASIRAERRGLTARVASLHVAIDEAIGESSELRYRQRSLQVAAESLFSAIASWRGIANHLDAAASAELRRTARALIAALPTAQEAPRAAARRLLREPVTDIGNRFLVDNLVRALLALQRGVDGLELIQGIRSERPGRERQSFSVPDLLPAMLNMLRVVVALAVTQLIWIHTAWSNGPTMIIFAAVGTILFSPRDAEAFRSTRDFAAGTMIAAGIAAVVNFAVLPAFDDFVGFALVLAFVLTPLGAISTGTWWKSGFIGIATNFLPLLCPSNQPVYDPVAFLNSALGIVAGTAAAALSMRLIPPLSPQYRTARLLMLTLRDLRTLAVGRRRHDRGAWATLVSRRLAALPPEAALQQHARLIAALSIGDAVLYLRRPHRRLRDRQPLDAALAALSAGDVAAARGDLERFGRTIATSPDAATTDAMRCRVAAMIVADALERHADYFEADARWFASLPPAIDVAPHAIR